MATTIYLRKLPSNALVPADEASGEALELLKVGAEFKAVLTQPRNYKFHRKAFALIQVAFDAWQPEAKLYKGQPVAKNLERLREDITILAGYYTVEFNWKGEPRFKADSWSFANMDETSFEKMYSKMIDVILAKILGGRWTAEDLDYQVQRVLQFS